MNLKLLCKMDNNTIIKKIPLDQLIEVLIDLYNKGVDYIDLIGEKGDRQDKMSISFNSDYMTKDGVEHFKENTEPIEISTKLTDKDLNQLL